MKYYQKPARPIASIALIIVFSGFAGCRILQSASNNSASSGDSETGVANASAQEKGGPQDAIKNQNGAMAPSRRPADGLGAESIPDILRRTQNELKTEAEHARKLEESYSNAQKQIDEFQRSIRATTNELEAVKIERDRAFSKVHDLQERLISAALRVAESEKDTIQTRIQLEQLIKIAATHGVIFEESPDGISATSRPAEKSGDSAGAQSRPSESTKEMPASAPSNDHK